jgi:lipopolysaccharide transport system permease protein
MSVAPSPAFAVVTTHRELVENLVARDVKARYKQSVLGYAWAVLQPLLTAVIMWLVGGVLLKQQPGRAGGVDFPFPVYSYFGILFWNLFSTGLLTGTESLVSHFSLITKVYFPREVFPVSSAVSKLVDFGFGLAGLIFFLVIFHVKPSVGLLACIPLALLMVVLTAGLGMLLSCANLFYRDVRYLVNLALSLVTFLIPNFYVFDAVLKPGEQDRARALYLLNPVTAILEGARRLAFPQTGPIAPILPYIGIAAVTSFATLVIGYAVFKRNEPRFAEFI